MSYIFTPRDFDGPYFQVLHCQSTRGDDHNDDDDDALALLCNNPGLCQL